jgi:hypothetical protein
MVRIKEGLEEVLTDTLDSLRLARSEGRVVEVRGMIKTKLDEISPVSGVEGSFGDGTKRGGKELVIDHVELGGNGAGTEVEDLANGSVMVSGSAEVRRKRAIRPEAGNHVIIGQCFWHLGNDWWERVKIFWSNVDLG